MIWLIGGQLTWYALAICLSLSGTSCFASDSKSTNPGAIFIFDSLKNEVAHPVLPARPVRPIRWTYSSTSDGKSKLITWRTFEMSNPLAATAVATRIGAWPLWNMNFSRFFVVEYDIYLEKSDCIFTFSLVTIAMDTSRTKSTIMKIIIKIIRSSLRFSKNDCQHFRWVTPVQKIQ